MRNPVTSWVNAADDAPPSGGPSREKPRARARRGALRAVRVRDMLAQDAREPELAPLRAHAAAADDTP